MKVGALRHRITIQAPTDGQDSIGAVVTTWSDVATVWAAIEPLTSREMFNLSQTFAEATHKVTIRYLKGITPKHRILFGSRAFDIQSVSNPEERNIQLVIIARELL